MTPFVIPPPQAEPCREAAGAGDQALLLARAAYALGRRARGGRSVALLCLRVDRLASIAGSLGPRQEQELVALVRRRLEEWAGDGDTVAHLGGERFAVLLDGVGEAGAATAAEGLRCELGGPFAVGGEEVFTSVTAGVAVAADEHADGEALLRDAHAALRDACARGDGCRVADPSLHRDAAAALRMETALRHAVRDAQFRLWYQPIVSLESGRVAGFEALLRWEHPMRGLLPPSEFLPLAGETGLMVPIGRWVLRTACAQLREWRRADPERAALSVNVNLSGDHFRAPGLLEDVERALEENDLPGSALRLEITETAIMESGEAAVELLCRLKSLGVQLCIDDFGTGYSSLRYLSRFPIDGLKIDRSFIAGLCSCSENEGIVRTIVTLAHGLGIHAVPEGVETAEQLAHLRALECEFGQGHFFARAMPADAAEALLRAAPRW